MGEDTPLLTAIVNVLKQILAVLRSGQPKLIAGDRDLDSKYGDPIVKFNPRAWGGESYVGRRMSECPAEFLDALSEVLDWFGDQAEAKGERTAKGKPVAPYNRLDASRARGWAKRIREGGGQPAPVQADLGSPFTSDDDVPF